MNTRMTRNALIALLSVALPVGASAAVPTQASGGDSAQDVQILAELQKALSGKRFAAVNVSVHDGSVVLAGTVDVYSAKEDADKKAHHQKNVKGVQNMITVAGPTIEDSTLTTRLQEKLTYDRVGYGTTEFNAITVAVHGGAVTLGGVAYGPTDKDSAVSLVENYPGVKEVTDNIEVEPTSPMDDRIRIAEARAIYGYPSLNRYSLDPAKPIRIAVKNGNVTLFGVVDSQADKDTAGIRANGVAGVFHVTNDLQVAGSNSTPN